MTARKNATPPAEEHRAPAPAGQEVPGVVETPALLLQEAQREEPWAEVAPDLVADRVPYDRRDDDHHQHAGQGHVPQLRGRAGEHRHGLAGEDEPDEESVLGEHHEPSDQQDQPAGEPEQAVDQTAHAGVDTGPNAVSRPRAFSTRA